MKCFKDDIELIINDFFDCCNIPTKVINKDLKELCSVGYNDKLEIYFLSLNIFNNIKSTDFISNKNLSYIMLSFCDDIHFLIMPIHKFDISSGYFVIGPFKSCINNDIEFSDIPFKPLSCIDYISNLLSEICHDKMKHKPALSFYVKKTIDYIHKNYSEDITVSDICNDLQLNKSYFCSLFKKESGYTFTNFLNKVRVEKSKKYLLREDMSILDVAVFVGFNSQNYYSMVFKKFNNLTPIEYKNIYN